MRHCVFCASNDITDAINIANQAKENLELMWDLEEDCVLQKYHSYFTVNDNDGGNTSIYLENDDIHQLIKDCMEFAIVHHELKTNK